MHKSVHLVVCWQEMHPDTHQCQLLHQSLLGSSGLQVVTVWWITGLGASGQDGP